MSKSKEVMSLVKHAETANSEWLKFKGSYASAVEHAWNIGQALTKAKAADTIKHGEWQAWCEKNLHFSYRSAQLFMQVGSLPSLPEIPAKAQSTALLTLEDAAAIAARVKKGVKMEQAVREFFFPAPPARTIFASDEEPAQPVTTPALPEVKSKKQAKEYLTREQALDVIGISADKEDVEIFVNRTSLEILFEGLMLKHKADDKKMRALKAAKLFLLD